MVGSNLRNASTEILSGGDGDDIFAADNVPATKDTVSCGRGFDRIIADKKDVVASDCEKVQVVHGSEEEVLEQEDEFFESLPPALYVIFETFFEEQLAPFPEAARTSAATSPAIR